MEIKQELNIKAPAETIYNAMSTDKGIKGWWSLKSLVGEQEGKKSLLKFDKNKDGNIMDMLFETETLIPNQKVVWNCIDNSNPAWIGTKIITEIKVGKDGVNVVFSHSNFDEKWAGMDPFEMTKGGWLGHFLPSLVSFCENGNGQPW